MPLLDLIVDGALDLPEFTLISSRSLSEVSFTIIVPQRVLVATTAGTFVEYSVYLAALSGKEECARPHTESSAAKRDSET